MKINKSKIALSMLILSATSVSFFSNAEESFSSPSSANVALTFVAPIHSTLTTVTKVNDLPNAGVLVASDTLLFSSTGQEKDNGDVKAMGTRFTPGLAYQTNVSSTGTATDEKATLLGANNPNNVINIKMVDKPTGAVWKKDKNNITYLTTANNATSQTISFGLDGAQTLAADEYTASIDTAMYYP